MKQTVVSFQSGLTTSGLMWYASAVLSCGHVSSQGTSWGSSQTEVLAKQPALGTEIDCPACEQFQKDLTELRRVVASGIVSHSRSKPFCGRNRILVYRYDDSSPSGFFLVLGIEERPEVLEILKGHLSPLSPTEKR